MAKAYVSEYKNLMKLGAGTPQIADESSLVTEYVVDFTAGEAHGANFNAASNYIRVNLDSVASIAMASAAVATTSNKRQGAGTEYYALGSLNKGGNTARFSAITNV